MSVEIRTCRPEELGSALNPLWHYFGRVATDDDVARIGRILPAERLHAAFEDGTIVGGAGAFALEVTIPGGVVPAAGVMAVGVLPTHRRRGILTALMRRQLEEARERGEPLAMLYASEGAIYRPYGYGVASLQGDLELEREWAGFFPPAEPVGRLRLVGHDEALELLPPIYDRVRSRTPGMLGRTRDWWEVRRLSTSPWQPGERLRVVLELAGRLEAYAIYRIEFSAERMISKTVLHVVEAIGTTPAATREIWRYLFSVDWVHTIRAGFLPVDHPLFLLLAEPRRMRFTLGEALWVRIVDAGAALGARARGDDEVVIDLADPFCPWNEGRWRVGRDGVERTDADADLRCDAAALGSVYLGGFSWAHLAQAGRVEELRPGGLARADAVFTRGPAPWCPEIF